MGGLAGNRRFYPEVPGDRHSYRDPILQELSVLSRGFSPWVGGVTKGGTLWWLTLRTAAPLGLSDRQNRNSTSISWEPTSRGDFVKSEILYDNKLASLESGEMKFYEIGVTLPI